jgi:predicted metal-binding membrane protein
VGIVLVLVAIALVAWLVTGNRMEGMDDGPGTDLGSVGFFVTAWVVMMAAMMFPSVLPMVRTFAMVQSGRAEDGGWTPVSSTLFVAGYVVVWTAFGLLAYAAFDLVSSLDVSALSWDRDGPFVAAAVLVAAAVYELTPLKEACLRKCRNPLGFVVSSWRGGPMGAVMMGAEHGAWCVGCCWALMAALFALGVMSIGWMVFIAALVAAEKMLPWPRATNLGIALLLLLLAAGVAFAPDAVPGLTQPDQMESGQMQPGQMMSS